MVNYIITNLLTLPLGKFYDLGTNTKHKYVIIDE